MRGVSIGGQTFDLGRKELYSRIPEVTSLLHELLGEDYLSYEHRVGVLFEGALLEYSSRFRGPLRGASPSFLARALVDLMRARLSSRREPLNLEEALIRRRGALLTRAFSQGYQEKFTGVMFRSRPPASESAPESDGRELEAETLFRHPRLGTQQIVDAFVERIQRYGGELILSAKVDSIVLEGDAARGAFIHARGGCLFLPADAIVSALPILSLARVLGLSDEALEHESWNRKRLTLIGYFRTDEPARFPHAWLLVSCPRMKIARITNYAGFDGEMVPQGEGAIGAEIFLRADDPYHQRSDEAVLDAMERELVSNELLRAGTITQRRLIRLRGAEASSDYRNWERPAFKRLSENISRIRDLYDANRAGTDVAIHAGMEAARAVLSGDRARFIAEAAPTAAYDDFKRLS